MSVIVPKPSNTYDNSAVFIKDLKEDTDGSSVASNNGWESEEEYSSKYSFIIKKSVTKKVTKNVKTLKKEEYLEE
jgi:hypothetical protein